MNKKTIAQILMISLILIISFLFYFKYIKKNNLSLEKKIVTENIVANNSDSSNYIKTINYTSSDAEGNRYQITANQAEIDINNPDIMFLKDIVAFIFIQNSDTIKIISDFGKYNSKNYDTIFSKNVIILYTNHKMTGEYLDFSFLDNRGTMSTNVVYSSGDTNLIADRIEMNISTKDTKIFMNGTNKKVLIKGSR
tara:strand:+ start:717 stop:1301 length:585 start_codon:yes stop_codon:yes gene_type:complete